MCKLWYSDTEKEQTVKSPYGRLVTDLKKSRRKQNSSKGMLAMQGGTVLTCQELRSATRPGHLKHTQ